MKLGNYEWDPDTDVIAQGAFAEVFKAKDITFNTLDEERYVALKIYKESVIHGTTNNSSNQKKYSLEKEFKKAIDITHTNIISFYSIEYLSHQDQLGRNVSYPVVAMEYAKDGTLKDFMQNDPTALENRIQLIEGILDGLGYLHEEGIIHRDMKPGNILITRNRSGKPIAKITDFGISKDILSKLPIEQSYTEGVGTPHYMAPEQFAKKKYGFKEEISTRTDLWGVGVIVYWLFSGKLPFGTHSKDYEIIREDILNKEPDYTLIPEAYHNFLKKCFKKHASKRAASCKELKLLLNDSARTGTSFGLDYDGTEQQTILPTIQEPIIPSNPSKNTKKPLVLIVCFIAIIVLGYGGFVGYKTYKISNLLSEAWDYYNLGYFKEAKDLYAEASDMGSGKATYMLSNIHYNGYATDINYKKGKALAEKAIEQGDGMANYILGWMYQDGKGVKKDTVKALSYFEKSKKPIFDLIDNNDVYAKRLAGNLYYHGFGVAKDEKKAFDLYLESAKEGNASSMSTTGWAYYYSNIIDKNTEKAIEWFKKGIDKKHPNSYYLLSRVYASDSIHKNVEKAFELCKIAAENNNLEAMSQLGHLYANGIGIKKDNSNAFYWWKKAASFDDLTAISNLGWHYNKNGDSLESKKWHLKAANLGSNYSMYHLAKLYENKFKQLDSANFWYKKSAKNGYSDSQFQYGYNLGTGKGLTKNYKEAFKWYNKSAKQNNASANNNVGLYFQNGNGVEKNLDSAFYYFKQAHKLGSNYGTDNLAWCYYSGKGTSKNLSKAFELFSIAANNGNKYSQRGLGLMYYYGEHVKRNKTKAKDLFLKSYEQGDLKSAYYIGEIYVARDNYRLARTWYLKSSSNRISQYKLGLMSYHGIGGARKSKADARKWLRKSCDQGLTESCNKIREWQL